MPHDGSPSSEGIWQEADRVAGSARAGGALVPLENRVEWLEDSGFRCAVHVLGEAFRRRPGAAGAAPAGNPFLPPDPALVVAELTPTHIAILNKFPVIDRHLLVVTRAFVDQETPLALEDFEALWRCLPRGSRRAALGFYNSGRTAGASQPHRHLQVVPLPLGGASTGTPFERAFAAAGSRLAPLPGLPFRHLAVRLEDLPDAGDQDLAARAYRLYLDALRSLGRDPAAPGAYNLIATRRLLCVVPRVREHHARVSVNALGFCGVLLAVDDEELSLLRHSGPLQVLSAVAG